MAIGFPPTADAYAQRQDTFSAK